MQAQPRWMLRRISAQMLASNVVDRFDVVGGQPTPTFPQRYGSGGRVRRCSMPRGQGHVTTASRAWSASPSVQGFSTTRVDPWLRKPRAGRRPCGGRDAGAAGALTRRAPIGDGARARYLDVGDDASSPIATSRVIAICFNFRAREQKIWLTSGQVLDPRRADI